jgi:hypothetical protein
LGDDERQGGEKTKKTDREDKVEFRQKSKANGREGGGLHTSLLMLVSLCNLVESLPNDGPGRRPAIGLAGAIGVAVDGRVEATVRLGAARAQEALRPVVVVVGALRVRVPRASAPHRGGHRVP